MTVATIDATLAEIRELIHVVNPSEATMERLADAVERLDEHMSNGGALPADWRTKSPCHI